MHDLAVGLLHVVAMNMPVKNRDVLVGRDQVHYLIAVAREPFPFGLQIEQRPMGKQDDRRGLGKAREISLEPRELIGADFGTALRYIVERDEMHALVIE